MERIKALVEQISQREDTFTQENGAVVLSGAISGTRPTEYCYELFKPLGEQDIRELAEGYRNPFPQPLEDFYRITNGAFLFGRWLSIFGMPAWSAQYKQPIALVFADGHRTKKCPKERLFFASYSTEPETQVFFDTRETGETMKVYAARYGSNDVIAEWPSFADWLLSEHERLAQRYVRSEFRLEDIVPGVLTGISFE